MFIDLIFQLRLVVKKLQARSIHMRISGQSKRDKFEGKIATSTLEVDPIV
jgi:hypothetical protein